MLMPAGSRVGPYEILSALGAGGMGEVYRARDSRLNRDVALKLLPALLAADPDRLRRFEQEARAAAALNHPNILAIYDVGTHEGQPYIVSELLEGTTLREPLVEGALPVSKAVDIARQLASGLTAAHAKGITHRDIKPENLFLISDGRVKILDLGLAKLREAAETASTLTRLPASTERGVVLGTVGYMSPEQVRGQTADARSDIFSTGVVLFEMLAGTRPFKGDSAVETMSAILKADPPDLAADRYGLPPSLDRIVRHCLEKNPDERFQSAQDLAFALQSSVSGNVTVVPLGATVAHPVSSGAIGRRERVAWSVASIVCLIALGLAAFVLEHNTSSAAFAPVVRVAVVVPAPAAISRVTSAGFLPNPLALSPDGRYLVFVASVDGTRSLWVRPLDSLAASRLNGSEGAYGPFWSPDSGTIGFFANGRLKRIAISGGDPQTLCETDGYGGATWNPTDVILVAPSIGGEGGLVRVAAGGGAISPATRLDPAHAESNHVWPAFLPDGRHFLYNVLGRDNAGIYVGALDSNERTLLVPFDLKDRDDVGLSTLAYAPPGYLLYVRSHTLLAQPIDVGRLTLSGAAVPIAEDIEKLGPGSASFSVSNTGVLAYWTGTGVATSQLTWRARSGSILGTVGEPGGYTNVVLAPDGRRIAVSRIDPGSQSAIWVVDVTRGTSMKVSFDPVSIVPVWSPDSESLVYGSARDGPPSLVQKTISGGGPGEVVLKSDRGNTPTDWCAGGRTIVYETRDARGRSGIWTLPLSGDHKPVALLQTPYNEGSARCSPDGRWLAYSSDESGREEVYVTTFPSPGAKSPISTGGGTQPRWRPDGTELFFVAADRTVTAVPIRGGSTFDAGAPAPLFKMRGSSYAPAADGQRVITDEPVGSAASQPITVVLNWLSALKR